MDILAEAGDLVSAGLLALPPSRALPSSGLSTLTAIQVPQLPPTVLILAACQHLEAPACISWWLKQKFTVLAQGVGWAGSFGGCEGESVPRVSPDF